MSKNLIGSMTAYEKDNLIVVGVAYHDAGVYPDNAQNVETFAWGYANMSIQDAIRQAEDVFNQHIGDSGDDNCMVFVDRRVIHEKTIRELGFTTFIEGIADMADANLSPMDPQYIRAQHARHAIYAKLRHINSAQKPETQPWSVIVTGGPANISTGSLGDHIVETMLNTDGNHADCAAQIGKLYYITPRMTYKPVVPNTQLRKLKSIQIKNDEDILTEITRICDAEHVGLIIHTCILDEYDHAGHHRACAEDLIEMAGGLLEMAGCEPAMISQATTPPRTISELRRIAPDALIFGVKLLENVTGRDLIQDGIDMRRKNKIDFVIASDLARIGTGKHPAIFIDGNDTVVATPRTAQGIADQICDIVFNSQCGPACRTGTDTAAHDGVAGKTYWHVIAANNMNTDVRIEGFAENKADAWRIMAAEFKKTANELIPDIAVPEAEYLDMNDEHDFGDDKRHIKINQDGAQVFDGSDMWYYNLVPMNYTAVKN